MSKRAEEAAAAFHNQALLEAQKYVQSRGGDILQEVAYGRGLKTGFIKGYEQAEKDLEALILKFLDSRNDRDYATVGWIKKNFGEYKKEIMEED